MIKKSLVCFIFLILGISIIGCTAKESLIPPSTPFTETICPDGQSSCDPSKRICPKGYHIALGCGGCVTTPRTLCEVQCSTNQDCIQNCHSHCKECSPTVCPECALKPCTPDFSRCKCFILRHPQ